MGDVMGPLSSILPPLARGRDPTPLPPPSKSYPPLGAGTSPLTDGGVRPELDRSSRGVGGGAPEENFASKTIFRTKNAYSEDVKHLVQKLSSRPPRIWAHSMM